MNQEFIKAIEYIDKRLKQWTDDLVPVIDNKKHNMAVLQLQNTKLKSEFSYWISPNTKNKAGGSSKSVFRSNKKVHQLKELINVNYCGGTTEIKVLDDFWNWSKEVTEAINLLLNKYENR